MPDLLEPVDPREWGDGVLNMLCDGALSALARDDLHTVEELIETIRWRAAADRANAIRDARKFWYAGR